jgi:hypothetical protein
MTYTNSIVNVENLLPRLVRISTSNQSIFHFEVDPSLSCIPSNVDNELERLRLSESQIGPMEVKLLSDNKMRLVSVFNHRNSSAYGQVYPTIVLDPQPWRYGIPGNIQTFEEILDFFNQKY